MAQNEVQVENSQPGTPSWQLSNPAVNREIEGYASLTSVNKGGSIDFFVSTQDSKFNIDVFRMGWYGGAGARLLQTIPNVAGQAQPTPAPDGDGLIECQWTKSQTLAVPNTWTSGIYLARLTGGKSGKQSYIIFVVRDDARDAALFYNLSVNTYQAYNFWPGEDTGRSLYEWGCKANVRARKVSFNRPYVLGNSYSQEMPGAASGLGAGEFLTNLQPSYFEGFSPAGFECNMVRWLEKSGFDVTYGTNIDVHENANLLSNYRGFLSVGHDEYWSMEIRTNLQNQLANGVNLGVFSSNTAYWQVRFEPSSSGAPNRTMVCYKDDTDPKTLRTQRSTGNWRFAPVNMPEAALIGVQYVGDPVCSDIVISNASHWLLEGTHLKNGDHLKGLLGYEVDAYFPDSSPQDTEILARSPISGLTDLPPNWSGPPPTDSHLAFRKTDQGTCVFATGSMQWSWGLDDFNAPALRPVLSNAAVQSITNNLLTAFTSPITISMPARLPAISPQQSCGITFSTIGGTAPLTWTASELPPYLTMSSSGVLSGTPPSEAANTTINFSVTVKDASGASASKTFTLRVAVKALDAEAVGV